MSKAPVLIGQFVQSPDKTSIEREIVEGAMGHEGSGSLESLRERNRRRVLSALRVAGITSRAELARRTGLSRTTVSSLIGDLVRDGLVAERVDHTAAPGAQGGRPPVLVSLDRRAGAAVGVDFGKSHVTVAVADLGHTVLSEMRRELPSDHRAEQGLDAASELVEAALTEAGVDRSCVLGVGMGLPGPVHADTGTVGSTSILPGWVGVAAARAMSDRLSLPVRVDNDANLGALAEHVWGAGEGVADMIYLKLATGIGAGIVVGGEMAACGDVLLDPLRQECQRHAISSAGDDVEIHHGPLGDRAQVLGALALVLQDAETFSTPVDQLAEVPV